VMANPLRDFERSLERLFEGGFARAFKTRLHPRAIATELRKEMDASRLADIGGVLVHNEFTVEVSPGDFAELETARQKLERELADFLAAHAREFGYRLAGPATVELKAATGASAPAGGAFRVASRLAEGTAPPAGHTAVMTAAELATGSKQAGFLVVEGKRILLDRAVTVIGRSLQSDIPVGDPAASRAHAELRRVGDNYYLFDSESTNGTFLNGERVEEAVLAEGDVILIGETELRFERGG